MNFKRTGNRRDEMLATIANSDINTVTNGIAAGTPLVLAYPGADFGAGIASQANGIMQNGLGVLLPSSTSAAWANSCFYGINTAQVPYLQQGSSMVFGYYSSAIIRLATRAASTDTWTATTLVNWAMLTVDTVNNCLAVSATNSLGAFQPVAVLVGAISVTGTASNATVTTNTNTFAGSATTTADTRTVVTALARVQIRCM